MAKKTITLSEFYVYEGQEFEPGTHEVDDTKVKGPNGEERKSLYENLKEAVERRTESRLKKQAIASGNLNNPHIPHGSPDFNPVGATSSGIDVDQVQAMINQAIAENDKKWQERLDELIADDGEDPNAQNSSTENKGKDDKKDPQK